MQLRMMGAAPRRRVGMSGLFSEHSLGEVRVFEASVSAAMDATNTAVSGCSNMQPTDVQQWAGIYAGWQKYDATLKGCMVGQDSDSALPDYQCSSSLGGWFWDTPYGALQSYAQTVATWQQRVHNACPNYQPAPIPTPPIPPKPPSNTPPETPAWVTAVKWGAAALITVAVVTQVGPLLRPLVKS